jgi:hypothetical protein
MKKEEGRRRRRKKKKKKGKKKRKKKEEEEEEGKEEGTKEPLNLAGDRPSVLAGPPSNRPSLSYVSRGIFLASASPPLASA